MKITLKKPDDMHVHLRDGAMLPAMVAHTARHFSTALVMPNTTSPILTCEDALQYRRQIVDIHEGLRESSNEFKDDFTPLMTIKLTGKTTPQMILDCRGGGGAWVCAAKLYPEGVTTNSHDGVKSTEALYPVFEAMQDTDMVLSIHGGEARILHARP